MNCEHFASISINYWYGVCYCDITTLKCHPGEADRQKTKGGGGGIKQLEVERARGRHEVYNETMETI